MTMKAPTICLTYEVDQTEAERSDEGILLAGTGLSENGRRIEGDDIDAAHLEIVSLVCNTHVGGF